jgi:hypothetical protein
MIRKTLSLATTLVVLVVVGCMTTSAQAQRLPGVISANGAAKMADGKQANYMVNAQWYDGRMVTGAIFKVWTFVGSKIESQVYGTVTSVTVTPDGNSWVVTGSGTVNGQLTTVELKIARNTSSYAAQRYGFFGYFTRGGWNYTTNSYPTVVSSFSGSITARLPIY